MYADAARDFIGTAKNLSSLPIDAKWKYTDRLWRKYKIVALFSWQKGNTVTKALRTVPHFLGKYRVFYR